MAMASIRMATLSARGASRASSPFWASSSSSLSSGSFVVRYRASLGGLSRRTPLTFPRRHALLPFSTSVASTSAAVSKPTPTYRRLRWRVVARVAYYLRIPFLVLSVYGFGYQQGIMDYSREPERTEAGLMEATLAGVGCTGDMKDEVIVAKEGEWRGLTTRLRSWRHGVDEKTYEELHKRVAMAQEVAGVGEKIVKAAQSFVKEQLTDAVREASARLPPEIVEDRDRLHETLREVKAVDLWTKAAEHMEGPWRFVLVPSPIPNAFVTEVLPRRIFVTTSFLETFVESRDELALVLGHELSHLILGHSSERNALETSFRTAEILLLSLDPTEGLLSLVFMTFLASVRNALGAVYSRENERSADEMGIRLCARACYDTEAASRVFQKMHLQHVESGAEASSGGLLSFFDSHPPSDERFRALLEESATENRDKYRETSCRGMKEVFEKAMRPKEGAPRSIWGKSDSG